MKIVFSVKNAAIVFGFCIAVLFGIDATRAANTTWDASGANPAAPTDGSGNWNTTTDANWSDGATDATWVTGNTAVIGANNGAAGTITINDGSGTVSAAGINFSAPASGSYTIASATNETLTLTGATINVASGVMPTINTPIAGTAGLTVVASGSTASLTLGGVNTYSGNTIIDGGGTVKYTANNVSAGTLIFGVPSTVPYSTTPTSLDLSAADLTVGNLDVRINSTTAPPTPGTAPNVITLGSGRTFTVNNSSTSLVTIGPNVSGLASDTVRTVVNVTGAGGSVVINHTGTGSHFLIGRTRLNGDANGDPAATFDLTGTTNYTESSGAGNGELRIGGNNVAGTMRLANTPNGGIGPANSITVTALQVGNTGVAGGDNNNAGNSTLSLGSGTVAAPATNVIQADNINVGTVKGQGTINFQGATGSVVITGKAGGNSNANITMANYSSATGSNGASSISLAGHNATVQAGTVSLARAANGSGGTPNGTITFDTGTFTVANSLQLTGQTNVTNNIANGVTGTFTLGGAAADSPGTGVLNVSGQFLMVNRLTTTSTTPMNATFNVNGGTANINVDIGIVDNTPAAARTPVINLQGGTLNMTGKNIGTTALPITLNAKSGTLQNLNQLNGGGALTKSGAGTLVLAGTNTHTGATNVTDGKYFVNGTHTGGGAYTVSAGATLGGTGSISAVSVTLTGANSTLAPGTSVGTLTVGAPVVFNSASKMVMELNGADTTQGGGVNDLLVMTGGANSLTLAGTLDVLDTPNPGGFGSIATPGSTWTLATYEGGLSGSLALGSTPALGSPSIQFAIDTSVVGKVLLSVVAVPEANAFVAIGLVTFAVGAFRCVRTRMPLADANEA